AGIELISDIIRNSNFNPTDLIVPYEEKTHDGWSKTLEWTDEQGRTFKITTGQGYTFEDFDSDEDEDNALNKKTVVEFKLPRRHF
ncbi:hypothetical protein Q6245_28795, partial [Klebsiella pneumoniae]|uniref:hypothetical protein n=1 Tax=Klebsiella pneumoniae TaxID=573 RepID=UPI0027301DA6